MSEKAKGPVAKVRVGAISCSVWENQISVNGTDKTVLKASVERRYKASDGTWKSSTSFSRSEVPIAVYCLGKAFEKMIGEESGESDTDSGVQEEVVI